MKKKVLIITYYWPPSGGSGVQRWLKFAHYLPQFDITPYVLTVDPEKASYPVLDESMIKKIPKNLPVFTTNTFELSSLYKRFISKGTYPHSGFANELNPSFKQKISRFIRGNFFIPDSRVGWKKFAVKKAIELIDKYGIEIVITTGPPHSVHLIGLKLMKRTGIKWIADFRDPWTDILYYDKLMHTSIVKKYDAYLERKVIENASNITIVSHALKELIIEKSTKIHSDKIIVIPNGFNENDFKVQSRPPKDIFRLTFVGTLSNDLNRLDSFVEGVAIAIERNKDIPIQFCFVGNIDNDVKHLINKNGLEKKAIYISYVPHNKSIEYLKNSTVLFFAIHRTQKNKGILSGKVFDYLGAQKPIICIGPEDGNAAEIIRGCNAGRVLDYENKSGIVSYLQELIDAWKINPNIDLKENNHLNYSVRTLTEQYSQLIKNITSNF